MKALISTISSFVYAGISHVVRYLIRETLVANPWLWRSTKPSVAYDHGVVTHDPHVVRIGAQL